MMDREGLRRLLDKGIEVDLFSGAQAALVHQGQVIGPVAVGWTSYRHAQPEGAPLLPISQETRFDLASLTKAVVTAPLVWHAMARGIMSPQDPSSRWLPQWHAGAEAGVTMGHLLTHTSGLPAWVPLHREARALVGQADRRALSAAMQGLLMAQSPQGAPGKAACYSDLGYMLLGLALERALGGRLDELAKGLIFDPLGMTGCRFVRSMHGERLGPDVAATEATEASSHGPSLSGEVHDENAWSLGGVAGHAGLFGTADDLLLWMSALLGADGGPPAPWGLTPSVVRWAMSPRAACLDEQGQPLGSHLGGLDTPSGPQSTAGPHATASPVGTTVGHLGFTGTSMWIDRSRKLGVVLLTNRVHPKRDRPGFRQFRVDFHTEVIGAFERQKHWVALPEAKCVASPAVRLLDAGRRELDVAVDAALRAGSLARSYFHRDLRISHKGDVDLVTQADVECEELIVETLRAAFPQDGFMAEEDTAGGQDRERVWIIDPIDGTTNFSHRLPHFCICIALQVQGQLQVSVTYDPIRDELFTARRGHGAWLNGRRLSVSGCRSLGKALSATGFPYDRQTSPNNNVPNLKEMIRHIQGIRRAGSAGLDMAYVAAGRLDLYWELRVKPWDVSAGVLLVEEAGGRVTDPLGRPFDRQVGDVLATCGPIHAEAVARLTAAIEGA